MICPKIRCLRGPESSQTLAYLGDPCFAQPLRGERPALEDRCPSQKRRKSLFGRDRNCLFCLLLRDGPLLAKLIGCPILCSYKIMRPPPKQDGKDARGFPRIHLLGELPGPAVGVFHLGSSMAFGNPQRSPLGNLQLKLC